MAPPAWLFDVDVIGRSIGGLGRQGISPVACCFAGDRYVAGLVGAAPASRVLLSLLRRDWPSRYAAIRGRLFEDRGFYGCGPA